MFSRMEAFQSRGVAERSDAPARRGFTLVELLVVIGIIALLIGLLMPALSRSRESAKSLTCLTNLRQFATAASLYCQNNRGYFPPAYYTEAVGLNVVDNHWDFKVTRSGSSIIKIEPGTLWGGRVDLKIQQCPNFEGKSNTLADPYTGYNYNTSYIGHGQSESIKTPAKQNQVHNPALVALFGDGQYSSGANKFMRAPFSNPGDAGFGDAFRSAGTQGWRHHGYTNVGFCDGHAQSIKERYTSANIPGLVAQSLPFTPLTGFLSADNSMYRTDR